ncbi:hypothetical protein DL96DRAFT_1595883 [Flagelloscypha sp. PMI_526]|nr:hypothetical protein DL96DRAFT_1595883 [Flagelloscypha sp. PMI_526]
MAYRLTSFDFYSNFLPQLALNLLKRFLLFRRKCNTDPHLFEIVQEYKHRPLVSKSLLLDQAIMSYASHASPRIVLARNYVRVITLGHMPAEYYIQQALQILPSLIQIYLLSDLFPYHREPPSSQAFDFTWSHPSLRKISTAIGDRGSIPPNGFNSPFWMTITHLQLTYVSEISSSGSAFQLPLFVSMPSLTHLALSYMGVGVEPDDSLAFSRVRKSFPPSLILCLLGLRSFWIIESRHQLVGMTDTFSDVDERIVLWWTNPKYDVDEMVVVNRTDSFEGSCRVQGRVPTFWEMGEAVLKRRRERLGAV